MSDDRPPVDRDRLTAWFVENLSHEAFRDWSDQDFADAIIRNGVLLDAADVRRDALAAVEAELTEKRDQLERLGMTQTDTYGLTSRAKAEALTWALTVLAGDTSALNAVKAAERERIAQAIEREAETTTGPVSYVCHTKDARIAREGGGA